MAAMTATVETAGMVTASIKLAATTRVMVVVVIVLVVRMLTTLVVRRENAPDIGRPSSGGISLPAASPVVVHESEENDHNPDSEYQSDDEGDHWDRK